MVKSCSIGFICLALAAGGAASSTPNLKSGSLGNSQIIEELSDIFGISQTVIQGERVQKNVESKVWEVEERWQVLGADGCVHVVDLDCPECKYNCEAAAKSWLERGGSVQKKVTLRVELSKDRRAVLINGVAYDFKYDLYRNPSSEINATQVDIFIQSEEMLRHEGYSELSHKSSPRPMPDAGFSYTNNLVGRQALSKRMSILDETDGWDSLSEFDKADDFEIQLWSNEDGTLEIVEIFTKSPAVRIYNSAFDFSKLREYEKAEEEPEY